MTSCCAEFDEHRQNSNQDGFVIFHTSSFTPHESRLALMRYQMGGRAVASVKINFAHGVDAT
jgi:hypothetical protein